ncbi:MAG TPA: hypothetical protein VFF04_02255 [Candidatus Babeliales bacterium]|nr:hypothetical protein [Candidatus Babeliales bacterium]
MKILSSIIIVLMLAQPLVHAGVMTAVKKGTVFSAKKYPTNTDIPFELLNDTKFPIHVIVSNATPPDDLDDTVQSKKMKKIEPGERYTQSDSQIDPEKTIIIRIYENKTTGEPSLIYKIFAPKKTKYLVFELKGNRESLYPQIGSRALATIRGAKTDSGFLLKDNVSQNDIQYVAELGYKKNMQKMKIKKKNQS